MTRVEFYRTSDDTKIVTVCMENEGNRYMTKHIKKGEINESDYMVCMNTRFEIKDIEFNEGTTWVKVV